MADITKEVLTKVVLDNKQAVKASKDMEKQQDATTESTVEYGSALDGVLDQFGPLGGAIKGVIGGFRSMVTGLKSTTGATKLFGTAMKAIPIFALIAALTSLLAFFTSTQAGMDAVSDAFAVAKAIMTEVINTLASVGKGFVSILSGNFRQGIKEISDGFSGMGERIGNAVTETLRLEQAQRDLDERMRGITILQAQLNLAIKDNILLSRDLTLSEEERLEAIQIAQQQQEIINEQNIAFAEDELELLQQNNELKKINGELTDDQRDAEIDLQVKVLAARAKASDATRTLVNRQNTLEKEVEAERIKRHEAWLERQEERAKVIRAETDLVAEQINERLKSIKKGADIEREIHSETLEIKKRETEVNQDELDFIEDQHSKLRRDLSIAHFGEVIEENFSAAFKLQVALAELGIEGGRLGKALALVQAIIDSKAAIISAAGVKPFLPLGLAAIVTATAIGAAQVLAIRNQQVKARGGMIHGPSHAGGGVNINTEGGEAVINKVSTARFRPLLSKINSFQGAGVQFAYGGIVPKFQTGGIVPGLNTLGSDLENAIASAPPVAIVEDIVEGISTVEIVEDVTSIGE